MEKGHYFEFDPVVFVPKLVITIGADYSYITERFENKEGDGKWPETDPTDDHPMVIIEVFDKEDRVSKILCMVGDERDLVLRNICHESFHVAINYCRFCNMGLGFNAQEDEHAAYIAGWFGNCIENVFRQLEKEGCGDDKEKNG